jgi:hypothetical protein
MPVQRFIETSESRSATLQRIGKRAASTISLEFMAFGTSSDTEVHAYCNTFFSSNRFYVIGTYRFMVESYSVEYLGDEAFRVTANYTLDGQDAANDGTNNNPLRRTRSFDTSGGTQHITQAESEQVYSASGPTGPGQFKAIGVDGDSVAGVDVVTPALQWTETYDVPSWYVTASYIKTVADLTGTVNAGYFRTFRPGEVLFAGCNGNQQWDAEKGDGPWTLQYKFIASPNRGLPTGATGTTGSYLPPLEVGSISGIVKKGHEYLWVRYEDDVDDSTLLKKPKHVYVNQVYREADFTGLGIGGATPNDPAVVAGGTYTPSP